MFRRAFGAQARRGAVDVVSRAPAIITNTTTSSTTSAVAVAATALSSYSQPSPFVRPSPSSSSVRTMACKSSALSSSPSSALEKIPSTSIRVLRTVSSLRRWRKPHALDQRIVGLVPTMGALHAGHESLIRQAARECHHVIVSLYVNPAQFGASEDLDSYPQTWAADCESLRRLSLSLADDGGNLAGTGISAVFAPTTSEMYPSGFPGQDLDSKGSFVTITPVGELLEGKSRPTFFRGVATVCMKLFNIVQPDRVYFGQKDVQQTVVISKMVRDFHMPIAVVVVPTVREPDGLALSSRNVYLGQRRRRVATVLSRALRAAEATYYSPAEEGGKGNKTEEILGAARQVVDSTLAEQMSLPPQARALFEVDYISLADPESMEELSAVDPAKGAILSGAIKMSPVEVAMEGEDLGHSGGPAVRLIDNIVLKPTATTDASS